MGCIFDYGTGTPRSLPNQNSTSSSASALDAPGVGNFSLTSAPGEREGIITSSATASASVVREVESEPIPMEISPALVTSGTGIDTNFGLDGEGDNYMINNEHDVDVFVPPMVNFDNPNPTSSPGTNTNFFGQ